MIIGIDGSGVYGWRGPSRNIRSLITNLVAGKRENSCVIFSPEKPTAELSDKPGFQWIIVKAGKFVPWHSISLPLAAMMHKVDVMLFPNQDFWLWAPPGIKTIVIIRFGKFYPWHNKLIEKLNVSLRKRRLKKIADRVVTVSNFCANQLEFGLDLERSRLQVIPNALDSDFICNNMPRQYDVKYLLFVGGTEENKNVFGLIRAFEKVIMRQEKLYLVIVGGKYVPSLQSPAIENYVNNNEKLKGRVIFHGIEKDSRKLVGLYRHAELVVFPSFYETFGLISLEAMACGTPLVASRMPAIPEIAGDAAEYFDPYDVNEMAEKIEKVLNDETLRQELIRKGKERVKKYSWEESARKLIALIEEVAGER
jgi:glycosyltransferase involved in cell wall biosynthesis